MAFRDWSRPLRIAVAYGVLAATLAIFLGSAALLIMTIASASTTGLAAAPWSSALVLYSTLVTSLVVTVSVLGVFHTLMKKSDKLAVYFMMGVFIGVAVGLVMIPLTGGFSLVCAPAVAPVIALLVWRFRTRS
jgi:hypothetical protein